MSPATTTTAESTSWDAWNELLLHGPLDRFTKLLCRYELFKKVIALPGDIVECGVYKGTGVLYWARLAQIFNPVSARRVVGFDTFAGYPESTTAAHDLESGAHFVADGGAVANDPATILDAAEALGLRHRVELVAGDAVETIAAYARNHPGFRIALLNLDFDTFEPTAAALEHLYPLIVPGGVIVCDEYAARGWGESDAVDAFFAGRGLAYHAVPWALSPSAFLIKAP